MYMSREWSVGSGVVVCVCVLMCVCGEVREELCGVFVEGCE